MTLTLAFAILSYETSVSQKQQRILCNQCKIPTITVEFSQYIAILHLNSGFNLHASA